MADVTERGYVLKTQNEYFTDLRNLYLAIDPDWDLDPSTPDGLKIAHDAEVFGNLDEELQAVFNSKDPDAALRLDLIRLCALSGVTPGAGTPSNVSLTLGGVAGTVIPRLSRVRSSVDASLWETTVDATIGGGGTIVVNAQSVENGAIAADPNTITEIVNNVGGWQTATNPAVSVLGTNPESTPALRRRRNLSVSLPGNNRVSVIHARVGNTTGVRRVEVYENYTKSVDANGLPPNSIAVIADGGTDLDVGTTMYLAKPPGVLYHPAGIPTSVVITDPENPNNTQTVNFGRPTIVAPTVLVEVTDDGSLPGDADDQIKQSIVDYANGGSIDAACGFNIFGFNIGEDVPITSLYTPINQVIGSYGRSYITNLLLNGSGTNLTIAFDALAQFTTANITVTIT